MTREEMINQLILDLQELKEVPYEAVTEFLFEGLDEGFAVADVSEIEGYDDISQRYGDDPGKFETLMENDEKLSPLFEAYRGLLSDQSYLTECHQFRMGFGAAVKLIMDGISIKK